VILDTSFLIDLFDGEQAAFEKGVELSDEGVVQRVPSPVVTEISYGAEFGDEEERRNVRNALRMYPVVEQDEDTARCAGELLAEADAQAGGESGVGWIDAMIAAVGEGYEEPVLTDNVEDFEKLGVGVETY
jgi:predicted nucleic acid-binding protein